MACALLPIPVHAPAGDVRNTLPSTAGVRQCSRFSCTRLQACPAALVLHSLLCCIPAAGGAPPQYDAPGPALQPAEPSDRLPALQTAPVPQVSVRVFHDLSQALYLSCSCRHVRAGPVQAASCCKTPAQALQSTHVLPMRRCNLLHMQKAALSAAAYLQDNSLRLQLGTQPPLLCSSLCAELSSPVCLLLLLPHPLLHQQAVTVLMITAQHTKGRWSTTKTGCSSLASGCAATHTDPNGKPHVSNGAALLTAA